MKTFWSSVVAALAGCALLAGPSRAQQLLAWPVGESTGLRMLLPGMPIRPLPIRPIPRPGPHPIPGPRPGPIEVPQQPTVRMSAYHVEGKITDSAAELTYNITFHNPTPNRLEGVLIVPLPAETVLSGFTMTVGGKKMNAELLESGKATAIYDNIVRQMRDPGLLELVGERLLRAKVFPIEPNADIQVRIAVNQLLAKSGDLYSLTLPMKAARALSGTGGASASLTLTASKPIRTIYSPQTKAVIRREGASSAVINYEESGDGAPADLSLFYSMQEDPLAAGLLTFKEEGEDGYFLLTLSPKQEAEAKDVLPKDIVFIVDRSGSMEDNGKMEQAKAALSYCIGRLGASDRFGIVDFATDSSLFEHRLVRATQENKARAQRYVRRLEAAGGTNIEAALQEGLGLLPGAEGRLPMVFFLTDGVPTVGQTQVEGLLGMAAQKNSALRARLFSFGVGDDVNTLLLDKLAQMNRGARDYVAPGESIENKVSTLYQKVAKPALTDVSVDWKGVEAVSVYPRPVTDIFYGGELVLMGRYKGHGKGSLVVRGSASGKPARFQYPVEFPESAERNAFLPRLWANLKVAHELDAIRLSGKADPEVVDSIVKLAKRYGIVTPYTSFLITEEGRSLAASNAAAMRDVRALRMEAQTSGFAGGADVAMKARKASSFFSGAFSAPMLANAASVPARGAAVPPAAVDGLAAAEAAARQDVKAKGLAATEMRSAGGKTFYLREGMWVDGDLESGSSRGSVKEIRYLSEDYFNLLAAEPGLRRYLALGSRITVLWKGAAYRIID